MGENQREKSGLEQLGDFIDILGKYGTPFTMIVLSILYLFWNVPNDSPLSWAAIGKFIVAVCVLGCGIFMAYKEQQHKLK